jgi:hypothetical protein
MVRGRRRYRLLIKSPRSFDMPKPAAPVPAFAVPGGKRLSPATPAQTRIKENATRSHQR